VTKRIHAQFEPYQLETYDERTGIFWHQIDDIKPELGNYIDESIL
jgi:hypothetical protein